MNKQEEKLTTEDIIRIALGIYVMEVRGEELPLDIGEIAKGITKEIEKL